MRICQVVIDWHQLASLFILLRVGESSMRLTRLAMAVFVMLTVISGTGVVTADSHKKGPCPGGNPNNAYSISNEASGETSGLNSEKGRLQALGSVGCVT